MAKYYHIYILPKVGKQQSDIEKEINQSLDWIRYGEYNYVVYSTLNANSLTARLKPLVEPDGRLFVCKLDINNRNGWMAKSFWEWLKKQNNVMDIEERISELESKVKEIREDIGTTTVSTRGFYATIYKGGFDSKDLEIHLGCRGLSPKISLENGDYYQEYNAYYKYNDYKGGIVLDMKFNKNNEIIGCKQRPFKCPISKKEGDYIEYEYYGAIE